MPKERSTVMIHLAPPASQIILAEAARRGMYPGELVKLAVTTFLKSEKEMMPIEQTAKAKTR